MSTDESSNVPRWFAISPVRGPGDSPPPSVSVEVEFGARSRRGPRRFVNEDNYLILRLARHQETLMTSLPGHAIPRLFEESGYGLVIADGAGGHGEAASRLAIMTLVHLAVYFGRWNVRIDDQIAEEVMDRGKRFYEGVDAALLQASRDSPLGMQSTLTVVYTAGNELFLVHAGHSRAYLCRGGQLLPLTSDPTLTSERLGRPAVVDAAADAPDLRDTLSDTMATGGIPPPRIGIERCALLDNDAVLLCTNGLTDMVDDACIASVLRLYRTPDEQCRALVDLAFDRGGTDDVTALVAHYRIPG